MSQKGEDVTTMLIWNPT